MNGISGGARFVRVGFKLNGFLGVNTNLRPQKAVSHLVADKLTLQQPNKAEFKQRETKAPLAIASENDQAAHKVARPTKHAANETSRCSARVKHQLASRSVRDRDALTDIYNGHAAQYELAHYAPQSWSAISSVQERSSTLATP